jgi:hypothetical protein
MNDTVTNTTAQRATAFRKRMVEAGYVQVAGWVHRSQVAEVNQMLRRLREDKTLQPGPLRNPDTGRLVRLHD